MTTTDLLIGTPLDTILAPLDDLCRDAPPRPADRMLAYELALLSAELIGTASYGYLIAVLAEKGVSPGDAKTIARAFSSAVERVAAWVEAHRTGVME